MTAAAEIVAVIALLETLDLEARRALWQQRCGSRVRLRSPELLRLRGRVQAEGLELGVGARLRRTWRGTAVEVVVVEGGFRWNDRLYPSLSAAATAIAGSRWNGPRFFGLRRPAR